jgi:hypothetical protein
MKKSLFLIVSLLPALALFSCKSDGLEEISNEEAAEMVENAVVENTEGLTAQTIDMANIALALVSRCGESGDSVISRAGTRGGVTYSYVFGWDWSLTCSPLSVPQSFALSYAGGGTYATARMTSADSASGAFILTGLQPSSPDLSYSGTFTRNGTQTLTSRRKTTDVETVLNISTTNLTYNKASGEISGGTCTVALTTEVDGNLQSHTGSLVFNGGRTATLTLNGMTYNLSW